MKIDNFYDLVIIGSGPAGMSAAIEAAKQKMKALVLDDQSSAGGQVYRHVMHNRNIKAGLSYLGKDYWSGLNLADEFESSSVEVSTQSRVWQISEDKKVFFSRNGKAFCVEAKFVLIATGAMERPMPIPGWTLPGVMSVGAAQTLLKTNSSGADGAIFAGTGPLFYLTIWQYIMAGFQVKAVIDTAPSKLSLSAYLWAVPALLQINLLLKGVKWRSYIRNQCQYFSAAHSVSIGGTGVAQSLCFTDNKGRKQTISGEHFFIHQGVVPNINLTMATNLQHRWSKRQLCWHPCTDSFGESSVPGIFVAGDGMGIAGAGAAALSGKTAIKRIANYTKSRLSISLVLSKLRRAKQTAIRPFLDTVFKPPRDWLVPTDDTAIVCRCEALSKADIAAAIKLGVSGPNQLKSFCRAGMGRCQGRMCGLTVQNMIAEHNKLSEKKTGYFRLRPPIRPLTVGELAALAEHDTSS